MVQCFDHYRELVGKNSFTKPLQVYNYIVLLKDGTTKTFTDRQEAVRYYDNRGMTSVCTNQEEYDAYWANQGKLEAKALDLWYKDLQEDYDYLPPRVFDLCYSKAYDDGHSSGYDEVANYMISITRFAEEILRAKT